ncbi:hypothetical protein OPV22_028926 [Ensete ventricosum]|uniref:EF-hand domain-containing protein n=1 Tax=Ensete ventricosum TaxID=4639 RepID=A0AAV8QC06_ENSVE|nr:hypothetical protein OPV22_028926 [Ensete ventricosum]
MHRANGRLRSLLRVLLGLEIYIFRSSLLMNDWNDLEKKTFSLDAEAMNALFYALDKNESNRVYACDSAFDI